MTAIRLQDVRFGYEPGMAPVLDGIGFAVASGEVVAIVGHNGAGKSTLLRLLNGLLRPDAGRVEVNGHDAAGLKVSEIARHVGTVFQAPESQIFNATVRAEIGFGPAQFGMPDAAARVAEAVARTGLEALLDHHPLDLDAAARRFVAVASVLAGAPGVILLDEAQRGLAALRRARLGAIIAAEKAAGRAVILVCHDMDFVAAHADRVLGLAGGRLAVDAPVRAFFADARATRAVSVEQPGIVALAQALGRPVALSPAEFVRDIAPRLRRP